MPARSTNTGAQKWVIQRVKNNAAPISGSVIGSSHRGKHEVVAHVIDGHDHDGEATQHVDAGEAIGARVGRHEEGSNRSR